MTNTDDRAQVEAALAEQDGGRVARIVRGARLAVLVLGVLITALGLIALAVGLAAFRDSILPMIVITLLCAPALVLPTYVVVRTGDLTRAASNPRQLRDEAKGLLGQVRDSPELRTVADALRGRSVASGGKLRRGWTVAKAASGVIGQANPDPENHPLLHTVTPDRLGRIWWAAGWSLWGIVLALAVLIVGVPALVFSFL